jgi:hypothetical protein
MPGNPPIPDPKAGPRVRLDKTLDTGKVIIKDGLPVIPKDGPVRIDRGDKTIGPVTITPLPFDEEVVRPEDLLNLRFEGINLKREGGNLVRIKPEKPAYLVVHFPPQNYAEEAIYETAPGFQIRKPAGAPEGWNDPDVGKDQESKPDPAASAIVQTRPSGSTRLVYSIPPGMKIPYDLKSLLTVMTGRFEGMEVRLQVVPAAVCPPSLAVHPHLAADAILQTAERYRSRYLDIGLTAGTGGVNGGVKAGRPTGELVAARWMARSELGIISSRLSRERAIAGAIVQPAVSLRLRPPEPHETAIELPYHLVLSPYISSSWEHSVILPERQDDPLGLPANSTVFRRELWHTRLGDSSVRAVWTMDWADRALWPDGNHQEPFNPFRMSIDRTDRENIVHLSSNFTMVSGGKPFSPDPVMVNRLMLSSLGGWLDSDGKWELGPGVFQGADPYEVENQKQSGSLSVTQWRHIATMGRDQYVKVVYAGYLFPFRHRASLIKITERKFSPPPEKDGQAPGPRAAVLRQKMYIVVRDPILFYDGRVDGEDISPKKGQYERHFPFQSIRILTTATPDLDKPKPGQDCFVPHVGEKPFRFHVVGEDLLGGKVEFTIPLCFHDLSASSPDSITKSVIPNYINGKLNVCEPVGQSMSFADTVKPGDTKFEVRNLVFGAQTEGKIAALKPRPMEVFRMFGQGAPVHMPPYYPRLEKAGIIIPAVKHLSTSESRERPVEVGFLKEYLDEGWEKNAGQVYLQINYLENEDKLTLSFGGGPHAAGLIQPDMTITGLSRSMGPVAGVLTDLLEDQSLDPTTFFDKAKIFGLIPLSALIDKIPSASPGIPSLLTSALDTGASDEFGIHYHWVKDGLQNWPDKNAKGEDSIFNGEGASLELTMDIEPRSTSPDSGMALTCAIKNFDLVLFNLIGMKCRELRFTNNGGKKMDVTADFEKPRFLDWLSFVNILSEFIPGNGFSDPPGITVTPEGVTAGYSLALPPISMGAFSLQHVKIGAELKLPFVGSSPSYRFSFCEREDPFLVTVYIFGGEGYLAIEGALDTNDGWLSIEGSIGFGGAVALNFGVASGCVEVMGGIWFKYVIGGEAELAGYFKILGEVDVLHLISVSLELYLALIYETGTGILAGEARLTIEVDVFLFSTKVEVSCRKEFAGSDGDPTFAVYMAPVNIPDYDKPYVNKDIPCKPWVVYCDAFAPIPEVD